MSVSFEKIKNNCIALKVILYEKYKEDICDASFVELLAYANRKCGYSPEDIINRLPYTLDEEIQKKLIEKCKHWNLDNSENYTYKCNNTGYYGNNSISHLCSDCKFRDAISEPSCLGKIKDDKDTKTKLFPTSSLPPLFCDFVEQSSKAIKCPPDFIATSLLVASGALIGTARELEVTPTWKVTANLYACLIGSPSSKKSPAMSAVIKYVEQIENDMQDRYFEALEKFQQSNSKDNPSQQPELERIITNNFTVEAIAELLSKNKRGVLLSVDEISAWINGFGQYKTGKNSDKQFYLSAWNSSKFVSDRKGKTPIIIKETFVSVLGSIQPNIIRTMENVGDGFFERIIFSFPESNDVYFGSSDEIIDEKIEIEVSKCFERLHKLFYEGKKTVGLSKEARVSFKKFEDKLAFIMKQKYFDPNNEALYCKTSGVLAKIALILHCIKDSSAMILTKETMDSAVEVTEYYLQHSRLVIGLIFKEANRRLTDIVYKWLIQKDLKFIQPSMISKNNVGGIKSADDAKVAINSLISENRLIYDETNKKYLVIKE